MQVKAGGTGKLNSRSWTLEVACVGGSVTSVAGKSILGKTGM